MALRRPALVALAIVLLVGALSVFGGIAATRWYQRWNSHVPDLVDSITVAKRLSSLLRRKSTEDLEGVLAAAADTLLTGFAAGLRRDIRAVQASLDLPWTTSPAEGQINRLKMLKRTMYGRAGFALLRARVLDVA